MSEPSFFQGLVQALSRRSPSAPVSESSTWTTSLLRALARDTPAFTGEPPQTPTHNLTLVPNLRREISKETGTVVGLKAILEGLESTALDLARRSYESRLPARSFIPIVGLSSLSAAAQTKQKIARLDEMLTELADMPSRPDQTVESHAKRSELLKLARDLARSFKTEFAQFDDPLSKASTQDEGIDTEVHASSFADFATEKPQTQKTVEQIRRGLAVPSYTLDFKRLRYLNNSLSIRIDQVIRDCLVDNSRKLEATAHDDTCLDQISSVFSQATRALPEEDPFRGITFSMWQDIAARIIQYTDDIEHLVNSVVDADLRETDLTTIPLNGIRWSPETIWPAEWGDYIKTRSVEVDHDLFRIQLNKGDRKQALH